MKKSLLLSFAAIAFIAVSCDNRYDLSRIDNDITLLPGAKIDFPEGTNEHSEVRAGDLLGIKGECEDKATAGVTVSETGMDKGIQLPITLEMVFDKAAACLKSPNSKIAFEKAPLTIALTNPFSYDVITEASIVIDGKSIARINWEIGVSDKAQEYTVDLAPYIERVPDKVVIKDIAVRKAATVKTNSTDVTVSGNNDVEFSFSSLCSFPMSLRPGSQIEFTYAFDEIGFDVASLGIDVTAIEVKAKITSSFPVTIEGSASADGNGGTASATISKLDAMADSQEVTMIITATNGLTTVNKMNLVLMARNESDGVVTINEDCKLEVDLDSIILPEGIEIK